MHSPTEEKIIRSIDFGQDDRETARQKALFYAGLIEDYIEQNFHSHTAYTVNKTTESPANENYIIRKGSGVLTISTHFGSNRTYNGPGWREHFSFYIEARHHNEELDTTVHINDSLVFTLRIVFGILGAALALAILAILNVGGTGELLYLFIAFFAAMGGFLGNLTGQLIYRLKTASLHQKNEIDAVSEEWDNLGQTLNIIFQEGEGFSFEKARGSTGYE